MPVIRSNSKLDYFSCWLSRVLSPTNNNKKKRVVSPTPTQIKIKSMDLVEKSACTDDL